MRHLLLMIVPFTHPVPNRWRFTQART